ncbi:hypothetical protein J6Y73_05535 [bacterium]|nr:hypothetical protein [bacterium]
MPYITEILSKVILDSSGFPTVECEVFTESGAYGRASSASLYSSKTTIKDLRDKDSSKYFGLGVNKAVDNINLEIEKALIGEDCREQVRIDNKLNKLDNTINKTKLGLNAISAVSLAIARAASDYTGLSLHSYLGGAVKRSIPSPLVTIYKHNGIEIIFDPMKDKIIESLRLLKEVSFMVKENLHTENKSLKDVIQEIIKIAGKLYYKNNIDYSIYLNMFMDDFYDAKTKEYNFESLKKTQEIIDYYDMLVKRFNIDGFIDPLYHADNDGYKKLTKRLTNRSKIIGYNYFESNRRRIEKAISSATVNAVMLSITEIGTISEISDLIEYLRDNNIYVYLSASENESEDSFIADLGVALSINKIRLLSINSSGSIPKFNELIRIENSL